MIKSAEQLSQETGLKRDEAVKIFDAVTDSRLWPFVMPMIFHRYSTSEMLDRIRALKRMIV